MPIHDDDLRRLWKDSVDVCNFPGCRKQLLRESEDASHKGFACQIRGTLGTVRHDPRFGTDALDSLENHILLCDAHSRTIADPSNNWTAPTLLNIKATHKIAVDLHRGDPDFPAKLINEFAPFEVASSSSRLPVRHEDPVFRLVKTIHVDSKLEEGVDADLVVRVGDRLRIFARGLITLDSGGTFCSPEGIFCNHLGLPVMFPGKGGPPLPVVRAHPEAYETDGGQPGRVGSLIAWTGIDRTRALRIGSLREFTSSCDGRLRLAINDARGRYEDNDGDFRVDVFLNIGPRSS